MDGKLGPALAECTKDPAQNERLEVHVFLRPESPPVGKAEGAVARGRATVVQEARETARRSQERFLSEVAPPAAEDETAPFRLLSSHWVNNSLAAEISRDLLPAVLARPDVERVELVARAADIEDLLPRPTEPPLPSAPPAPVAQQVTLVGAPLLWDLDPPPGLRGNGVLVAVIDTGIDFDHPDLRHRRWNGGPEFPHHGFGFATPDRNPRDEHGHGTRCAGLIAGDGSSEALTTGVAPEATLMALRIGDIENQAWLAFEFAIEHEADIVSMSMSWSLDMQPFYIGWRRACDLLLDAGVVFVCSAGNEGLEPTFAVPQNIAAPANCPPPWLHPEQKPGGVSAAIACGETDLADVRDSASSLGPGAWETEPFADYLFQNDGQGLLKPDLCGPGRGSMTCNPRFREVGEPLHRPFGSTSAATAVVAGCAALLVQAAKRSGNPVVPQRIQQALEEGAVKIEGQTTKQNHIGSGRVDVFRAYEFGREQGWWH